MLTIPAVLLAILNIIHNAITSNKICSKRDIYYQDPALFCSQAVVDRFVDDIAYTFGASRLDLNVAAEARGLVAGPLSMHVEDGVIDSPSLQDIEGVAIPPSARLHDFQINTNNPPRYLLVIEKRATFHTISRSSFHITNNCILLTGQGYPDLATRSFLHYFHYSLAPRIPCYALVDFDPDGLSIYYTYAKGSQSLAHERGILVPDLHLIGLRADDALSRIAIGRDEDATEHSLDLPFLSQRERQRGKGLLKRIVSDLDATNAMDDGQQQYMLERWGWQESYHQTRERQNLELLRREVQICLLLGYKIELQILDQLPGGLASWLEVQILNTT